MKILKAIVLLFLSCGTVCAQAPLRSGKPVMSSDPEGVAPLGVLQAIASLPVGSAYLRASDTNPSVFLLAKVCTHPLLQWPFSIRNGPDLVGRTRECSFWLPRPALSS